MEEKETKRIYITEKLEVEDINKFKNEFKIFLNETKGPFNYDDLTKLMGDNFIDDLIKQGDTGIRYLLEMGVRTKAGRMSDSFPYMYRYVKDFQSKNAALMHELHHARRFCWLCNQGYIYKRTLGTRYYADEAAFRW